MSKKPSRPVPGVQQMTASPGPILTVGDETYRLGFNDQDAKGRLEALIADYIWAKVDRDKAAMPPKRAEAHEERYQALFDRGHYDTLGRGWQTVIASVDGVSLFLLSLLQEHHPELTLTDARRLFLADPGRCKRAIGAIASDFFTAVLSQLGAAENADLAAAVSELVGRMTADDVTPGPATATGSESSSASSATSPGAGPPETSPS